MMAVDAVDWHTVVSGAPKVLHALSMTQRWHNRTGRVVSICRWRLMHPEG